MADKEVHSQMVALGHPHVSFAHGTIASLYNGSILWHRRDKSSNQSFFTLYKNNPLLEAQTLCYLSLNILANNIDSKNIKEIKASQKQIVTVPKDYPKLINIIKMYHSMASILFGKGSALTVEIGCAIVLIKQEVSTIKVRIAGDFQYPEKILYPFKIHIQCWLCLCKQQEDQLAINDRIIDMDPVIKQILNSSLTIELPIVFVTTTTDLAQKKERDITPAGQQQGAEKRGKKRKGEDNDNAARKHIKNKNMVEEFKMKEGSLAS